MRTDRSARLTLELQACGPRVCGYVSDEAGREQRFASWLSLLGLLVRAVEPIGDPSPCSPQRMETS